MYKLYIECISHREPPVIHLPAPADKMAAKSSSKSSSTKALALYTFKAKSDKFVTIVTILQLFHCHLCYVDCESFSIKMLF